MATLVTYMYRCEEHGELTVLLERKDAGKPTPCCHCGKPMKQVFTPPAIFVH